MNFGDKVKFVREKLFLSQIAMGNELGVSFASVNCWETHNVQPQWKAKKAFHELCEKNGIKFEE